MTRSYYDDFEFGSSRRYVSVAERKEMVKKAVARLGKDAKSLLPVVVGQTIASSFWAKAWCAHVEQFQDYDHRLQRGRSYLRTGAVVDLQITSQKVTALVSGSELYTVELSFSQLSADREKIIQQACAKEIKSVVDLFAGKFSNAMIKVVTDPETGIFPLRKDIILSCNCLDFANLCKHVGATLYGVGARLDTQPELLFLLRGVDYSGLITSAKNELITKVTSSTLETNANELNDIFGIDVDVDPKV